MSENQLILEANQAFYRAFEKKDMEAMSQIWSKGVSCICIHPGRSALKGWDEIGRSWEQIFRNTSYMEIETTILSSDVSHNLAYVVLVENLMQVFRGRRIQAQSIATNIFEKMGEGWYLISHHGSPIAR
jgi:ketosteroid isomerase-like protein